MFGKKKNLENTFQFNWGVQSEIFNARSEQKIIIGVDAGGTKTLVSHLDSRTAARAGGKSVQPRDASGFERYMNNNFSSFIDVLRDYTVKHRISTQDAVISIAGAGPVSGPPEKRHIQLSNRSWNIRADEIRRNAGAGKVLLINDLEAMIYAVDSIQPEDITPINNTARNDFGTVAVIAAGTGLGESLGVYIPERGSRFAVGGEGGNSDFAPGNDLELELYAWLKKANGYVSWEDVLSGKGLINIYQFLKHKDHGMSAAGARRHEESISAEEITESGISGADAASRKALEIFVSLYGAEAGNLALKCLPEGGLFISGGIAPKILPALGFDLFMKRFTEKGRLRPVLEKIPVALVNNPDYGVIGALNYALLEK